MSRRTHAPRLCGRWSWSWTHSLRMPALPGHKLPNTRSVPPRMPKGELCPVPSRACSGVGAARETPTRRQRPTAHTSSCGRDGRMVFRAKPQAIHPPWPAVRLAGTSALPARLPPGRRDLVETPASRPWLRSCSAFAPRQPLSAPSAKPQTYAPCSSPRHQLPPPPFLPPFSLHSPSSLRSPLRYVYPQARKRVLVSPVPSGPLASWRPGLDPGADRSRSLRVSRLFLARLLARLRRQPGHWRLWLRWSAHRRGSPPSWGDPGWCLRHRPAALRQVRPSACLVSSHFSNPARAGPRCSPSRFAGGLCPGALLRVSYQHG